MNILIVDDESEIVEIIDFIVRDIFIGDLQTFFAQNTTEAINFLRNSEIDVCICDHNMPDDKGSKVLKYIIEHSLRTKFVLCSTVTPEDVASTYPNEHIFHNIVKPEIFAGTEKLAHMLKDADKIEAIAAAAELYIPIKIDFLFFLEKTPSDIYIKISDNKYVKCLENQATFSYQERDKYYNKGIQTLYCLKSHCQEDLEKNITHAIETVMHRNQLPLEDRIALAHSQLIELIKFTGISAELAEVVKTNITQTTQFIMQDNLLNNIWSRLNLKGEYPSKLYTLHSMLSSVVLSKLKWNTETTLYKLVMASFFQDISLESVALIKLYDHSDFIAQESEFTRHEIKNYLEHPIKTSELISNIKNMPPDIDKIILEHHEMPDGTGFPRKLGSTKLGPLSCTFILTGLLARYILEKGPNFDMKNFIEIFEAHGYSKGNFKAAFDIIKVIKD